MAEHIGIDLAAEWSITEAYLKKKTIKEILAFGKPLGILGNPTVQLYAMDNFKNCVKVDLEGDEKVHRADFSKLKKSELMEVILESGIDLVGKVPTEILSE